MLTWILELQAVAQMVSLEHKSLCARGHSVVVGCLHSGILSVQTGPSGHLTRRQVYSHCGIHLAPVLVEIGCGRITVRVVGKLGQASSLFEEEICHDSLYLVDQLAARDHRVMLGYVYLIQCLVSDQGAYAVRNVEKR